MIAGGGGGGGGRGAGAGPGWIGVHASSQVNSYTKTARSPPHVSDRLPLQRTEQEVVAGPQYVELLLCPQKQLFLPSTRAQKINATSMGRMGQVSAFGGGGTAIFRAGKGHSRSPVLHPGDAIAQTVAQARAATTRDACVVTTTTEVGEAAVARASCGGARVWAGTIDQASGARP